MYFEDLQRQDEAIEITKNAFVACINVLEEVTNEEYKDVTLMLSIMRDYLTLWIDEMGMLLAIFISLTVKY